MYSLAITRLLTTVVAFFSTTAIARSVDPGELGVYSIMVNIYGYLLLMSEFGLRSNSIAYAANKESSEIWRLYLKSRVLISSLAFLFATTICYIYFSKYFLEFVLVNLSLFAVSSLFDWLLLAYKENTKAGLVLLIRAIGFCASVLALIQLGLLNLTTLCLAFFVSWLLAAVLSILLSKKLLSIDKGSLPQARGYLRKGVPVLISQVILQVLINIDLLVVGYFYGNTSAGYYYLAATFIAAGLVFANAASQTTLAEFAKKKTLTATSNSVLKITLLGLGLAALTCTLGKPVFHLLFGTKYDNSLDILIAFSVYLYIYHPYSLSYSIRIAESTTVGLIKSLLIPTMLSIALYIIVAQTGDLAHIALCKSFVFLVAIMAISTNKKLVMYPIIGYALSLTIFLLSS